MECFCGSDKKEKDPDPGEECQHSFCVMQRQKKQCGCVDLPPKGLPWSTGLLKYIPGQRKLYQELVLDAPEQEDQGKKCPQVCPPPCKPPKGKKQCEPEPPPCACCCGPKSGSQNGGPSGIKKKKKKKGKGKRASTGTRASYMSSGQGSRQGPSNNNGQGNCCIELEEVYVCDGSGSEPRKGFLVRPCQRPEAAQAIEVAENEMEKLADDEEANVDQGFICLCIPRAYLKKYKGPQEDLCAPPCPPTEEEVIKETVAEEEASPPEE